MIQSLIYSIFIFTFFLFIYLVYHVVVFGSYNDSNIEPLISYLILLPFESDLLICRT